MKMDRLYPTFIPNSHKLLCEFGLNGQRHGRNSSDADELLALLAGSYTLRMLKDARRSRSPQMRIPAMPLTDKEQNQKA